MTCARCGEPIPEKRARYKNRYGAAKYCSVACNWRAFKARQAEAAGSSAG